MRHVIQDLIDQGLVHLGQPSVTTNPLLVPTSHAIPPPPDDIHFMNFIEPDDHIHIMSRDDSKLKPIIVGESYEVDGVILDPQTFAPFRLVLDMPPIQLIMIGPLILPCYNIQFSFILSLDLNEAVTQDVQYVIHGGRVA